METYLVCRCIMLNNIIAHTNYLITLRDDPLEDLISPIGFHKDIKQEY